MGKWDQSIYYVPGHHDISWNFPDKNKDAVLLWRKSKPPANPTRYNLSSFAITLNELTPELQVELVAVSYHSCIYCPFSLIFYSKYFGDKYRKNSHLQIQGVDQTRGI